MPLFRNRHEAGQALAEKMRADQVQAEQDKSGVSERDFLILVLPRGGAPVGFEVAQALHAEMDVFLVRKLGVPGQEELALGAIASGGIRVLNHELIEHLRLSDETIEQVSAREQAVLEARECIYRDARAPIPVQGRTAVLVDDGLATGATMIAAARAVRQQGAGKVIVAVPVAPREALKELRQEADGVICTATPHPFTAVGAWYEDFTQVTDEEVRRLLEEAAHSLRTENGLKCIQTYEGSL